MNADTGGDTHPKMTGGRKEMRKRGGMKQECTSYQ